MKAAIINRFGNTDVFEIGQIPKPIIRSDQVLIKVKTVGINPIDWKQRQGNHKLIMGSPFPIVLGYDVCGEVVELGSEITRFNIGDNVFGVLDNKYGGAMAEYAVGHENCFAVMPENISDIEAAAFPMVSMTALQAMRDIANIKQDQKVLINGASGGVGHISLQIAKLLGVQVIAVASSNSKEFVKQLNPDVFVDYKEKDILQIDEKVDVFFDVFGNYTFPKIKHLLNQGGIYLNLNYLHSITKMPVNLIHQLFSKGKKAKTMLMKHTESDLETISNWIIENKLHINIDRTFKLEEIKEAHDYAQQGHNKGKNVIVIS